MDISDILSELRKERLRLERELAILDTAIDRLDLVERGRQPEHGGPRPVATVLPNHSRPKLL